MKEEGAAAPSMVKAILESYLKEDGALTEEIEHQIKGAAGTLYVGAYSRMAPPSSISTDSLLKGQPKRCVHRLHGAGSDN